MHSYVTTASDQGNGLAEMTGSSTGEYCPTRLATAVKFKGHGHA